MFDDENTPRLRPGFRDFANHVFSPQPRGMNHDDEERPEDSSAAQCIRFNLLKHEFGPKFVHQIFPLELIGGYLPPIIESRPRSHPSFRGRLATNYLRVAITLSPSCQTAALTLNVSPVTSGEVLNVNKRRRVEESVDADEEDIGSEDSETDEEDLDDQEDCSADENPLTQDEIQAALVKFLPPLSKQGNGVSHFLSAIIGSEIDRFNTNDQNFILSIANEEQCVKYHQAVQKLSYWFIDAADEIELHEDGTDWKVIYLFHDHGDSIFSLAGYMTLYHFSSPFRKPTAGCIIRICQALILPPYQRMGHGKKMVKTVFHYAEGKIAESNSEPIVEVNCEDPAPGFQLLRTIVDYERCIEKGHSWFDVIKANHPPDFNLLKATELHKALEVSYTTVTQVHKVHELCILQSINSSGSEESTQSQQMKHFMKVVRSRLRKTYSAELGTLEGTEAMIRLDEMVSEEISRHEAVLNHAHGS